MDNYTEEPEEKEAMAVGRMHTDQCNVRKRHCKKLDENAVEVLSLEVFKRKKPKRPCQQADGYS